MSSFKYHLSDLDSINASTGCLMHSCAGATSVEGRMQDVYINFCLEGQLAVLPHH